MARNPRKHTQVDMSMPPIRVANIAPLVHVAVLIKATTAVWPEPPYEKKRSAACMLYDLIASETQWRWSTRFLCGKKEGKEDRIHRRQDLRSGEVLPPETASGEPVEKRYFYFRIFSIRINHYFPIMAPLLPHIS